MRILTILAIFTSCLAPLAAQAQESATQSPQPRLSDEEFQQRIGELFDNVLPTLDKTRDRIDRHQGLPDRTIIPLKEDKRSNQAQMNKLLDQAIEMLDVSSAGAARDQVRDIQARLKIGHRNIAGYRRKRLAEAGAGEQEEEELAPVPE